MRVHEGEQDVGAVGGNNHDHPLGQPLQNVLGGHAADHDAQRLAMQQFRIAAVDPAVYCVAQLGDRRCGEQTDLGQRPGRHPDRSQRRADRVQLVGIAPVGDHRHQVCLLPSQLVLTHVHQMRDLGRRAPEAADRKQHRRAQVHRDARVEVQLARADDVGVVAADDHHRVAFGGDRVVPQYDLTHGGVVVGVHLLVGEPLGLIVGQVRGRLVEQQFENVVALGGGTHDRPEHPHSRRRPQSICSTPSATVDLPVSPSGEAM